MVISDYFWLTKKSALRQLRSSYPLVECGLYLIKDIFREPRAPFLSSVDVPIELRRGHKKQLFNLK